MNRKILALAVPSIVANVTTPLLGLIDTAIVGHMGDAAYIGAIAVGGVMFNMLYWLFSFLRAGTSGLSAQAYGASDRDESAWCFIAHFWWHYVPGWGWCFCSGLYCGC